MLVIGAYFLAAWVGSSIPRNRDWRETPAPDGVEILIGTNGVHTEIVMPRTTRDIDWAHHFPVRDIADPARPYTHISFSWGEREIFLGTPTWADLKPFAALRIITSGGPALLHVAHHVRPAPSEYYRPLRISRAEYRALANAILQSLPPAASRVRHAYAGYGAQDVFYDARGTYTILTTCNQWTGERLARAGIRTGAWTPFPGGVMKWVPDLPER
jgi:uncharacterized protein (TIGR02117 family)